MTDKNAGKESAKTLFDRFTEFTRRIVAVPHSEVKKKLRAEQIRKQKHKNGGGPSG